MVIMAAALTGLISVFSNFVVGASDPLVRVRALELAQAQLDEILARKFDENSPAGGVPACGSSAGVACLGISPDGDYDDVGDYNGYSTTSFSPYTINVSVSNAGADLGLAANAARLIQVTVSTPATSGSNAGSPVILSAYKVNF